jgi:hypothetical protein
MNHLQQTSLHQSVKMKHIAIFCLCYVLVWATPLQKSPFKKVPVRDLGKFIFSETISQDFPFFRKILIL